jgi:hypothetical protein
MASVEPQHHGVLVYSKLLSNKSEKKEKKEEKKYTKGR